MAPYAGKQCDSLIWPQLSTFVARTGHCYRVLKETFIL